MDITVGETAPKRGIADRPIYKLGGQDQINGAARFGHVWRLPRDTEKPVETRRKGSKANHE